MFLQEMFLSKLLTFFAVKPVSTEALQEGEMMVISAFK